MRRVMPAKKLLQEKTPTQRKMCSLELRLSKDCKKGLQTEVTVQCV